MNRYLAVVLTFAAVFTLATSAASGADSRRKKSRFRDGPVVRGTGEKIVHEEGKTVVYKKKNMVDFDDSLIEGDVKNPSEFYFTVRPSSPGKNLIERRKNFHKEMLRDTVMIR
ncbi:MAG: hypothetical protein HY075_12830 [Deltaproteobacteria bacterium]|nr:hypothetical protein [Deltaproteobacteria bacterium]